MASRHWWREAARVRTISLAVACAGAAWALHRYRRKHWNRPDSGADCSPERPTRHLGRRRLSSEDLRSQAPSEDRRLAAHADAALKLNELYLTALGGSPGELEVAYGPEAPLGIVCAVRPRCLCATAAVTATVVVAALMALHAAITVSLGLSLLVLLGGAVGAAALALHWTELKTVAPRQARAAIARASVEVQPEATEAAWRSALAWASAPAGEPGRIRSFAKRGSHCILVEASPSALVAAPLDAFVLEPRGAEDSGGLRISAYTVPASRKPALELTAAASARLRRLLGEAAAAADAGDAEAAGGLGPGLGGLGRAGRPLLRPLAALQSLKRLEAGGDDASQVLDKGSLERLRIAGQLYESSCALLATPLTSNYWMAHDKNKQTGVEWSVRLDAATASVVMAWEVDVPHTDIIKAVACQMEWDLRAGTEMDPEVASARELCKYQGNPYIGTWHVVTDNPDSRVGKEDMVAHAICFDRLADPQGHIMLITGPARKSSGEYLGDSLPPKMDGYVRPSPDNYLWAATLTPLGRPGAADRRRGFRLRGAFRLPGQSEAVCKVASRTPSFLLRQMARPQVESASSPANLVHVVETRASELEERLRSSPRAELYEQLRRQLCGERPA